MPADEEHEEHRDQEEYPDGQHQVLRFLQVRISHSDPSERRSTAFGNGLQMPGEPTKHSEGEL